MKNLLVIRRPADKSDASVAVWLCGCVAVWLCGCICNCLSIFLCIVVTFLPRFHSDYLAFSATALSTRSTMIQMFSLMFISTELNCLLSLLALYLVHSVLKHARTRLTILTSSFLLQKQSQDKNSL